LRKVRTKERQPRTRRCSFQGEGNCGNAVKPIEEFPVRVYNPDGTPKYYQTYCAPCTKLYQAAYRKKNKEKLAKYHKDYLAEVRSNPVTHEAMKKRHRELQRKRRKRPEVQEAERKYRHEQWKRIKADPEWHARRLETYRIGAKLRAELRTGSIPPNATLRGPVPLPTAPRVDAEPFRQFLRAKVDEAGTVAAYIAELGLDENRERTIRRVLNENKGRVQLSVVEDILHSDGSVFLEDLYGEQEIAA